MVINLPNFLTFLRILLIPVFITIYQSPFPWRFPRAAVIFLIASFTDLLDGFLARRRGEVTSLGKLLDPVADKLLIVSALIILVEGDRVSVWLAILLVGREFAVMGLRAVALSEGIYISVINMGKYKMVLQTTGIFLLILNHSAWGLNSDWIGTLLLWGAVILALLSGGQYFYGYWKETMIKGSV
jgi:CDP-diacylglycerol--glycerol-3-phosphate 3-phosphatidyltransferase